MRLSALLIAAGLSAASFAARSAGAPTMADPRLVAAFGNTILDTFPDGRTSEAWLQPDGTYSARGRTRTRSVGRWFVTGPKLCFRQTHPFVFGYVYCTPIPNVRVGEAWSAKSPSGEDVTVRIVPGRSESR